MRYISKILKVGLIVVSSITLINLIVINWFPIILPFSLFGVFGLLVVGVAYANPSAVLLSLLMPILLFITSFTIGRRKILPTISLVYFIFELVYMVSLLVARLGDGGSYWMIYIPLSIIPATFTLLLTIYCYHKA